MADNEAGTETPAQRLIRERAERDLQAKDNQHSDAGASGDQAKKERELQKTDLTGAKRDEQQESSDRQMQGYGSKEPVGRVLGDEETPSDLKTDGSRSPHDASSEGGSRQAAAHKQVQAEQQKASEADAKLRGLDAPGAVNQAPTEQQAASGQAAAERGETK